MGSKGQLLAILLLVLVALAFWLQTQGRLKSTLQTITGQGGATPTGTVGVSPVILSPGSMAVPGRGIGSPPNLGSLGAGIVAGDQPFSVATLAGYYQNGQPYQNGIIRNGTAAPVQKTDAKGAATQLAYTALSTAGGPWGAAASFLGQSLGWRF